MLLNVQTSRMFCVVYKLKKYHRTKCMALISKLHSYKQKTMIGRIQTKEIITDKEVTKADNQVHICLLFV